MFNHSLRRMGAAILSLALALSLTAVPAEIGRAHV